VLKNPQVISLASNLASVGKGSININQTVGYLFQGNRHLHNTIKSTNML
jgi:hypothetical protein